MLALVCHENLEESCFIHGTRGNKAIDTHVLECYNFVKTTPVEKQWRLVLGLRNSSS